MDTDEEFCNDSAEEYVYEEEEDIVEEDDEEGEEYDEDEDDITPRAKTCRTEKSGLTIPDGGYIITEYTAILPLIESLLEEVSSLFDVERDVAQILLQNARWNRERLTDAFFSNPEKIMAEAGLESLTPEFSQSLREDRILPKFLLLPNGNGAQQVAFQCRICCEDCPIADAFCMGCGHKFCKTCYGEYLKNQIAEGPSCVRAHCPEHKCKQAVTKTAYSKLVDPGNLEKYWIYVTRNFIEQSKTMKYCPAPRCDKVALGSGITTVMCSCSNPFCFKCGEVAHDPCSCQQLQEWTQKCDNESETANWILAHTKKCPACNARIEKNQGCNHMSCKICRHEFCWICMGPWVDHSQTTGGFYKCNRYDPEKPDGDVSVAQKAKAELDRYLHYYQRYHGHDQALKFANNQRDLAEKKMVERQESQKSSWMDVQFLRHAAEQVIACRRVLKYTYVLGYFLKNDSLEKQLFEHHQEMLEKNTERLHECTEHNIEQMDRTQVVNLTRVTEKFMNSLLSTMSGGIVDAGTVTGGDPSFHYSPKAGTSSAASVSFSDGIAAAVGEEMTIETAAGGARAGASFSLSAARGSTHRSTTLPSLSRAPSAPTTRSSRSRSRASATATSSASGAASASGATADF